VAYALDEFFLRGIPENESGSAIRGSRGSKLVRPPRVILLFMKRASFLLTIILSVTTLHAQLSSSDDKLLDALFAMRAPSDVALSPDGKRVAWTIRDEGAWSRNVAAGMPEKVATGSIFGPVWSPDNRRLAYVAGTSHRRLFVKSPGQAPVQLTTMTGYLAEPEWSPDGKSIAFLLIENARREAGATVAMTRDTGVIASHIDEQRIAIVNVATRKVRIVSPADMYVYHFDWSPDGKQLVAEAAAGSGDNNYWIAQLHVVDVATATMKPLYQPKLQLAEPRWSPDGKRVAFLEGLMSDEGSNGGNIMLMNADGSRVINLTDGMKMTATSLKWTGPSELTYLANVRGEVVIGRLREDAEGWTRLDVHHAEENLGGGDARALFSADGKSIAAIRSNFIEPPDLFAGGVGQWKKVTDINPSIHEMTGEAKSIRWKSDEYDVQGWLLLPRNYDAQKKYPMVTIVHGGPSSVATARWPSEQTILLARAGFIVFLPNPRGSYGQGEDFTQANVKDFGYGDLRDILRGIDAVEAAYPVDDSRLGLSGWSYGGYMTMWAVTQTGRFKAAVAGAGIANWQSYYGENDITQWMVPFFGASVYDDPVVYAKSSPITYIKNVKTPTLIEVGERDGECPAPQSYEFWRALKVLGVETQLVVYPDEGHRFAKAENKKDAAARMVAWFVDHLR
jgi:dipeptidyl aminopeptidase/acylaminoacyl peptidase